MKDSSAASVRFLLYPSRSWRGGRCRILLLSATLLASGALFAHEVPDPAVEMWIQVSCSNDSELIEAFIRNFPDSVYTPAAAARLKRLREGTVVPGSRVIDRRISELTVDELELQPAIQRMFNTFSDPLASGGTGPEMVVIPAGSFEMGDVRGTGSRNEQPVHSVTLSSSFALSKNEVTFDEWDACVADGGCRRYRPDDSGWGRGSRPVIKVSWVDAQRYVSWLSTSTGSSYRLPTEAEWEYAARAGTTHDYHFGDDVSELCQFANHADRAVSLENRNTTCSDGVAAHTTVVGQYRPNSFGLYDMHGNVWEWVRDCWLNDYSRASSEGLAADRRGCNRRSVRGGSWLNEPEALRAANRTGLSSNGRYSNVGFRVAKTLAQ